MMKKIFLLSTLFISSVLGDVYMHNPRGSNDRLNEANTNRNNPNRLFDSQNNNKGGYCKGDPSIPYYYERSELTIEWTSQHACGSPKTHCNYVLQYMCASVDAPGPTNIRDGSGQQTGTIPTDQNTAHNVINGNYEFGMHEPYLFYKACQTRRRQGGLFIADRAIEGNLNSNPENNAAVQTRQNNNGNRHGYECPEERDYYPYWHPSPWKDIAVIVDDGDSSRCEYYKSESQNKKPKGWCVKDGEPQRPNNREKCESSGFTWEEVPSFDIDAPACVITEWNRDNHLGNTVGDGSHTSSFNWTIPTNEPCADDGKCRCVLRLRYNISSEVEWDWDSTKNGQASPVTENPQIIVEGSYLELAVDTTQFGRTFQDRSHVFEIRKRPSSVGNSKIYNLNVRGKRGNIVQAYPAVEYDFVPTHLEIFVGDYVHIQFKGCDNNPNGNAGEGTAGTDRSNMVQISHLESNYPAHKNWLDSHPHLFSGDYLKNHMALVGQDPADCAPAAEVAAGTVNDQAANNCQKLNRGPSYFDAGLIRFNHTSGSQPFYYMCTRNNNFTNRSQKGILNVTNTLPAWGIALVVIGSVVAIASMAIAFGMFYSRTHPHSSIAQFLNRF